MHILATAGSRSVTPYMVQANIEVRVLVDPNGTVNLVGKVVL